MGRAFVSFFMYKHSYTRENNKEALIRQAPAVTHVNQSRKQWLTPTGIGLSEVLNNFMSVTCAWWHHLLQTHQSKDTSCKIKLLKISTIQVSWFSCRVGYARRCNNIAGCKRWELWHWQQIWQANLMTSHLHLGKKKTDIHARFLAPQGHLEAQAAPDIKRW